MPARQQVLNIFGLKPMIQCSNYDPSTILTHPSDFKSRTSDNRRRLCFLTSGYHPWFLAYISLNFLGGPSHDFGLQTYVLDAQAGSTWVGCVAEAWLCSRRTALLSEADEKPDLAREEEGMHLPKMPLALYSSAILWHLACKKNVITEAI